MRAQRKHLSVERLLLSLSLPLPVFLHLQLSFVSTNRYPIGIEMKRQHKQLKLWPQNRFQNNSFLLLLLLNSKWPLTKITNTGMPLLMLFCQTFVIVRGAILCSSVRFGLVWFCTLHNKVQDTAFTADTGTVLALVLMLAQCSAC